MELRTASGGDLRFVVDAEARPDIAPWVLPWSEERHRRALADPDQELLLLWPDAGAPVGFAMLAGLTSPHGCIELRRLAVVRPGRGHGRQALRALCRRAFREHLAHRLWLDVREENQRARHLYTSEGFRVEGLLRECLLGPDGYCSLVVMALLEPEWRRL